MWISEKREWPRATVKVVGIWSAKFDREVGYCLRTEQEGWYATTNDGIIVNKCPAPEWWQHPPRNEE